ncbi:MAG: hypothetical protein K8H90_07760, partial [Thermoanaerobaculia bacterium]|nr:hypothetical protein [Thermoanaerobaculia bacterium]
GIPVLLRLAGLDGDRYYYGAGAALAMVLAGAMLALVYEVEPRLPLGRARRLLWGSALALLVGIAGVHGARLIVLERQWDRAGEVVREVQAELHAEMQPTSRGDLICIVGRPDNYQGRYILRSGITELIRLEAGLEELRVVAPPWVEGAPCTQRIELEPHEGVVAAD